MQRFPSSYFLSRLLIKRYRPLSLLILLLLLLLFFVRAHFTSTKQNSRLSHLYAVANKSSSWSKRDLVLVPVHIDHLYDYRVVCPDQNGLLDRTEIISQVSKQCQLDLHGNFTVDLHPPADFQLRSLSSLKYRTRWRLNNSCSILTNETLAIVIPYRDRQENLRNLLFNLVPFLARQRISNYKIFLVEQATPGPFNKGRLYNAAFSYLMKSYKPSCVILHDVDLIPENDQNLYSCWSASDHPIHMSYQVRFQPNGSYTGIYSFLVGGVLTIRPNVFRQLNGFSNQYFDWGGEDDDMGLRLLSKDVCVQRPTTGYYYATSHAKQKRNPDRFALLFDAVLRQDTDGLSDIDQLASISHVDEYPLVTWMKVQWTKNRSSNSHSTS